jgi:4-carboxymuconolactone decarboxylase
MYVSQISGSVDRGVAVTESLSLARRTYADVMAADPPDGLSQADELAFGSVWASAGITRRERRLTALVCIGWAQDEELINAHAYAALKTGDLTIHELLEWVLHFAVYCGWPKASTVEGCITTQWDRLRAERGEELTPLPHLDPSDANLDVTDWDERFANGRDCFRDVNLIDAPETNSPYRNSGIVGFVFGHLWQRPALTRRERRFITVPCVLVEEAQIPIWSHVGSALESGDISPEEMREVLATIEAHGSVELAERGTQEATAAWARISSGGGLLAEPAHS